MDAQPARIDSTPKIIALRLADATRPRIVAYSERCVPPPVKANRATAAARKPAGVIRVDTKATRPADRAHIIGSRSPSRRRR